MARNIVEASAQYARGAHPVTAYPFTMACWVRPSAWPGNNGCAIWLGDKDVDNSYVALGLAWNAEVRFRANASAFDRTATASANHPGLNTWAHICGVGYSANSRAVFLNGASKGTDANTASNMATIDRLTIGRHDGTTPADYLSGDIAEVVIWDVSLTDAEVALIAKGTSPLLMRPNNIVFYAPLWGRHSPEIDLMGGAGLTLGASPAAAPHTRVFYQGGRQIITKAGAAGATPASLVLSSVAAVASPTMALQSPALLSLSQVDAVAALLNAVSTAGLIVPSQVDAVAAASLGLRSPALLGLSAVAGAAALLAAVSTEGFIVPGTLAALSAATLALGSPTMLSLSQIDALAGIASLLSSPSLLSLSQVDAVAASTMILIAPALLSLSPVAGLADIAASLTGDAYLALSVLAGVGNATLVVGSPIDLALSSVDTVSALVSTLSTPGGFLSPSAITAVLAASALLRSPALLSIAEISGISTGDLAELIAPSLIFPAPIAAVGSAGLVVISPARLSPSVIVAAGALSLGVASPTFLILSPIAGVSTIVGGLALGLGDLDLIFIYLAAGQRTALVLAAGQDPTTSALAAGQRTLISLRGSG